MTTQNSKMSWDTMTLDECAQAREVIKEYWTNNGQSTSPLPWNKRRPRSTHCTRSRSLPNSPRAFSRKANGSIDDREAMMYVHQLLELESILLLPARKQTKVLMGRRSPKKKSQKNLHVDIPDSVDIQEGSDRLEQKLKCNLHVDIPDTLDSGDIQEGSDSPKRKLKCSGDIQEGSSSPKRKLQCLDASEERVCINLKKRRSSQWMLLKNAQGLLGMIPASVEAPKGEMVYETHRFALPCSLEQVEEMKRKAGNCPARSAVLMFAVLLAWSERILPRYHRFKAVAALMSRGQLLTRSLTAPDSPYSYGTTELSEFDRSRMLELRDRSAHVLRSYVLGTKPADLSEPIPFRLPDFEAPLEYANPNLRKLKHVVKALKRLEQPKRPSTAPIAGRILPTIEEEVEDFMEEDFGKEWHKDETNPRVYVCEVQIRVIEEDVDTRLVLFKSNANVRYPRGITLKREYFQGVKGWQCAEFWKLLRHVHE